MEHDAWFFVGVFVFIFLIWIATGGPLNPISFSGPQLAQPDVLGGGTYLHLPRAPFGVGGSNVALPGSTAGGGSVGASDSSVPSLTGSVFGTPSPYRGLVRMNHYVSGAGGDPEQEYITINVAQSAGVPVDLTGWTLVSDASNSSAVIARGTEILTSGIVNATQNIVLTPGTRAIITSGKSPIGGSFRENKCIGYFSSFQTFYPSLPQSCPDPSDEVSSYIKSNYLRETVCVEYVDKLSRCQVQLSPPVGLSNTCQSFLVDRLNYNGCMNAHKNDSDFLDDTWRIYLNRTAPLWRTKHEVVKLLDTSGKTVDAFSY